MKLINLVQIAGYLSVDLVDGNEDSIVLLSQLKDRGFCLVSDFKQAAGIVNELPSWIPTMIQDVRSNPRRVDKRMSYPYGGLEKNAIGESRLGFLNDAKETNKLFECHKASRVLVTITSANKDLTAVILCSVQSLSDFDKDRIVVEGSICYREVDSTTSSALESQKKKKREDEAKVKTSPLQSLAKSIHSVKTIK